VAQSTAIFQKKYPHNSVPIVVVVTPPKCCCILKLDIPSGVTTIGQKWGAHDGILAPGAKCCFCANRRIAAIVTQNSIRYDAPIRDCPTKDNVKVSIDISLTFRIGPGEAEYKTFVYELGPSKLDELLAAESEEAIRNFVRSVKLSQVQDIKGEIADTMLQDLNKKFNPLGVYFENVQIMTIQIPPALREDLAKTTGFDTMLQNQIKKHENDKLHLTNTENQKLIELQRNNAREIDRLNATKQRALIQRDE
jgi:regulator of protease activity HflC (stomatin/prohibitin superfamily)